MIGNIRLKAKTLKDNLIPLLKFSRLAIKHKKRIFLFGTPYHCNMGDQAQTYCIINWFKNNYPQHKVIPFALRTSNGLSLKLMRKFIHNDDLIAFHIGYHLTNLYNEQSVYCRIAQNFTDFPIIVFPQTINYTTEEEAQKTAKIFNRHGRITLLCRDQISFNTARNLFQGCNLLLYPDIVTSLIGTKSFKNEREGILLCMRNDKEAFYSKNQISGLRIKLETISRVDQTDTTINADIKEVIKNRETILNEIFEDYSKYKVIITDRYHGTIFSLIAGTPVIVLSSSDHKLSSGVKWFPESFSGHVSYVNDLTDAYNLADKILNTRMKQNLPAHFKELYWDTLKEKI